MLEASNAQSRAMVKLGMHVDCCQSRDEKGLYCGMEMLCSAAHCSYLSGRRASQARQYSKSRQAALPPLAVASPEIFGAQTVLSKSTLMMAILRVGLSNQPCSGCRLQAVRSKLQAVSCCGTWAQVVRNRAPDANDHHRH